MKCDELQYERIGNANKTYPASTLVVRKQFVDAAIAELKARINELESIPHTDNSAVIDALETENAELKAKLESVQSTAYTESVDAGMENRKLKRALWLARAERAQEMAWNFHEKNLVEKCAKWDNVHLMCRAKAEEYK